MYKLKSNMNDTGRIALIVEDVFINSVVGGKRNLRGRLVFIEGDEGSNYKNPGYLIRHYKKGESHSVGGYCPKDAAIIINEENLEKSLRKAVLKLNSKDKTLSKKVKSLIKRESEEIPIDMFRAEYNAIKSLRE